MTATLHGTARNRAKTSRVGALEGLRTSESAFANRPLFKRFREDRSRRDDQAHDQRIHDHRQVARAQLHVLHVLHGQKHGQKQKRNLKQRQLRQRAGSALYKSDGWLVEPPLPFRRQGRTRPPRPAPRHRAPAALFKRYYRVFNFLKIFRHPIPRRRGI